MYVLKLSIANGCDETDGNRVTVVSEIGDRRRIGESDSGAASASVHCAAYEKLLDKKKSWREEKEGFARDARDDDPVFQVRPISQDALMKNWLTSVSHFL